MKTKEVSDLGLIAALTTMGYTALERRQDGKRIVFVYETDPNFELICDNYFNHHLEVDAFTYHMALKSIKQAIWQMQHEGKA